MATSVSRSGLRQPLRSMGRPVSATSPRVSRSGLRQPLRLQQHGTAAGGRLVSADPVCVSLCGGMTDTATAAQAMCQPIRSASASAVITSSRRPRSAASVSRSGLRQPLR